MTQTTTIVFDQQQQLRPVSVQVGSGAAPGVGDSYVSEDGVNTYVSSDGSTVYVRE